MNKTDVPTVHKKTFPLRLPPNTYKRLRAVVNELKENDNYAFSINDYITELIEEAIKGKFED